MTFSQTGDNRGLVEQKGNLRPNRPQRATRAQNSEATADLLKLEALVYTGEKMSAETSGAMPSESSADRQTMQIALAGMSIEQLREVRSAIIRLKHLPFTKIVEALFTRPAPSEDETSRSTQVFPDDHAFVQEFSGHCQSAAIRELFADVQAMLQAKEDSVAK